MKDLVLPLKGIYFDQIKAGTKVQEFRLCTPFWEKRLEGKRYKNVVLTRGYPKRDDESRRLVRPWRGFVKQRIQHEFFGPDPVWVYAIDVSGYRYDSGFTLAA